VLSCSLLKIYGRPPRSRGGGESSIWPRKSTEHPDPSAAPSEEFVGIRPSHVSRSFQAAASALRLGGREEYRRGSKIRFLSLGSPGASVAIGRSRPQAHLSPDVASRSSTYDSRGVLSRHPLHASGRRWSKRACSHDLGGSRALLGSFSLGPPDCSGEDRGRAGAGRVGGLHRFSPARVPGRRAAAHVDQLFRRGVAVRAHHWHPPRLQGLPEGQDCVQPRAAALLALRTAQGATHSSREPVRQSRTRSLPRTWTCA
jgi:hypothetical protein